MDIEQLKNKYLENLDGLEKEVRTLLDRIEKARKEIPKISTIEEANTFAREHDLEEGLEHIELFG